MSRPAIPLRCLRRPVVGGLVVPWVNVVIADGGADFRSQHRTRVERCWVEGRCQVCGGPLGDEPIVLICGPNQLHDLAFDEPPLHAACAHYTADACPMVNGSLTHYPARQRVAEGARGKTCPEPGCNCGGWVGEGVDHGGEPAHEWFMVWVRDYVVTVDEQTGRLVGGAVERDAVRKVLRISRPGFGRCPAEAIDPAAFIGERTAIERATS